MRRFLLVTIALSACASPMSAPVAAARTAPPRSEMPLLLARFELTDTSPPTPSAPCSIGPSELDCETKLLVSSLRASSSSETVAADDVLAITREDGSVVYAQALRTGVSQARLRSSLPVTARK